MKNNYVLKFGNIAQYLGPKLDLWTSSKDILDSLSKNFCLETLYAEAKKLVSNDSSIEFYN